MGHYDRACEVYGQFRHVSDPSWFGLTIAQQEQWRQLASWIDDKTDDAYSKELREGAFK